MHITPDLVLRQLQHHVGKAQGIHAGDLVRRVTNQPVSAAHFERQVREAVSELRRRGQHICATPTAGYFLASTPQELDETCAFLHERAMHSLAQISAMKNVSLPDLRGQLHLPT